MYVNEQNLAERIPYTDNYTIQVIIAMGIMFEWSMFCIIEVSLHLFAKA